MKDRLLRRYSSNRRRGLMPPPSRRKSNGAFGVSQMMVPREVLNFITAEPFRPFRIQMASGRTFEVRHPELVQVGKSTLAVFTELGGEDGSGDRWHKVSLMLIECIEPIETKSSSEMN